MWFFFTPDSFGFDDEDASSLASELSEAYDAAVDMREERAILEAKEDL